MRMNSHHIGPCMAAPLLCEHVQLRSHAMLQSHLVTVLEASAKCTASQHACVATGRMHEVSCAHACGLMPSLAAAPHLAQPQGACMLSHAPMHAEPCGGTCILRAK
jgi:hypothetical protein